MHTQIPPSRAITHCPGVPLTAYIEDIDQYWTFDNNVHSEYVFEVACQLVPTSYDLIRTHSDDHDAIEHLILCGIENNSSFLTLTDSEVNILVNEAANFIRTMEMKYPNARHVHCRFGLARTLYVFT